MRSHDCTGAPLSHNAVLSEGLSLEEMQRRNAEALAQHAKSMASAAGAPWGPTCDFRSRLPSAKSMPQWFKEAGYTSLSLGKVFHQGLDDDLAWTPQVRGFVPFLQKMK